MSYSQKQVLKDNVCAITIVLENKEPYTPVEIEVLKRYKGFGGLKAVMWGDGPLEDWKDASKADRELYIGFRELYQVLDDNLTGKEYRKALDDLKASTLYAFFTPTVVPQVFYDTISKYIACESLYDPCAGSGVFITEAVGRLSLQNGVAVVEKDMLTAKVVDAICSSLPITTTVHHKGFEETGNEDDGMYDLICSNVPFGNVSIYDPFIDNQDVKKKVHNYFFAKGLQKVRDGGILAYLVTNAFLDTITNSSARRYVFERSDFISLVCMPDNLMKDSANTEAPSHFIVVRKNSKKTEMSEEEKLLCVSENVQVVDETGHGTIVMSKNRYIDSCSTHVPGIVIGRQKIGKNQYGKPSIETWWDGDINDIGPVFSMMLTRDFDKRYEQPIHEMWKSSEEKDAKPISQSAREALEPIEIPVGKVEILGPNKWQWEDDKPITQYPYDKGAVTVDIPEAEYEQEIEEEAKVQEEGIEVEEFDENSTCLSDSYQDDAHTDEKLLQEEDRELTVAVDQINEKHKQLIKAIDEFLQEKNNLLLNGHGVPDTVIGVGLSDEQLAAAVKAEQERIINPYGLKSERDKSMMKNFIEIVDQYNLMEKNV